MEITWQALGLGVTVLGAWTGLFLAALRWLLGRYFDGIQDGLADAKVLAGRVERDLLELKASLPRDYLMREDWIRFAG
jgi:hypothetical protein